MKHVRGTHLLLVLSLSFGPVCIAQEGTMTPNLTKILDEETWSIANREAKLAEEGAVYFEAKPGEGVAWLKDVDFANGTIEVEMKGTDVRGRSFVGIAFRGDGEKVYDAIYFRPFNFRSDDPARRGHSVQYVSHPDYPWRRLRDEHPEKYENPVSPAPDPNAFFSVKIVLDASKISVYVNGSGEPCLVVDALTDRRSGGIGLWMGNNSDGTFANLRITPEAE